MSPIGVDEWVARSGDRRERRRGRVGAIERACERITWWQRLLVLALIGFVFGQIGANGFTADRRLQRRDLRDPGGRAEHRRRLGGPARSRLRRLLRHRRLRLRAVLLARVRQPRSPGTGGVELPTIATIPIVVVVAGDPRRSCSAWSRCASAATTSRSSRCSSAWRSSSSSTTSTPAHLGGNNGIFALQPWHGFGGQDRGHLGYYYVALIILIVLMAALHLLDDSRTGRAWRAMRDDQLAARVMTIPVNARQGDGVLLRRDGRGARGLDLRRPAGQRVPDRTSSRTSLILIYACLVLGGVGSIWGAVARRRVVTVAQALLTSPTDYGYLFYGLILLALLTRVRPWQRARRDARRRSSAFGFAARAIVGAISPLGGRRPDRAASAGSAP